MRLPTGLISTTLLLAAAACSEPTGGPQTASPHGPLHDPKVDSGSAIPDESEPLPAAVPARDVILDPTGSPGSPALIVAGADGSLRWMSIASGEELAALPAHSAGARIGGLRHGRILTYSREDGTVHLFTLDGHETVSALSFPVPEGGKDAEGALIAAELLRGAERAAVARVGLGVEVWDLTERRHERKLAYTEKATAIRASPDGTLLAVAGPDYVRLMESGRGQMNWETRHPAGNTVTPRDLQFSRDGRMIFLLDVGGQGTDAARVVVRGYSSRDGRELWQRNVDTGIHALAMSPDSGSIAAIGSTTTILLYAIKGTVRVRFDRPGAQAAVFAAPGAGLFVRMADGRIERWDL